MTLTPHTYGKAAYICIDFQQSQVEQNEQLSGTWNALRKNISEDIRKCAENGIPVIYIAIKGIDQPAWSGIGSLNEMAPSIQERLKDGSERFDLDVPNDAVVGLKEGISILSDPLINKYLKEQGFDTFFLSGVLETGLRGPERYRLRRLLH